MTIWTLKQSYNFEMSIMPNIKYNIFLREFQPMTFAPNDAFYHQTKIPIGF